MYDELVKALRETDFSDGCPCEAEPMCASADCIIAQAADAIENTSKAYNMMAEAYESEVTKPRWIPVTERLPEEKTPVQVTYLGYNDKKPHTDMLACLYCGYWCYWDGVPCSYNKCRVEVTHWMPLPEPPKEET